MKSSDSRVCAPVRNVGFWGTFGTRAPGNGPWDVAALCASSFPRMFSSTSSPFPCGEIPAHGEGKAGSILPCIPQSFNSTQSLASEVPPHTGSPGPRTEHDRIRVRTSDHHTLGTIPQPSGAQLARRLQRRRVGLAWVGAKVPRNAILSLRGAGTVSSLSLAFSPRSYEISALGETHADSGDRKCRGHEGSVV